METAMLTYKAVRDNTDAHYETWLGVLDTLHTDLDGLQSVDYIRPAMIRYPVSLVEDLQKKTILARELLNPSILGADDVH